MDEVKERIKPKELKLIGKTPDWLNLPNPIATNIILEHLDVVDYIKFSSVCKDWQLIQREHRIRYSPYSPPLSLSFPWLICDSFSHVDDDNRSNCFYLPYKQCSYNIPVYNGSFCVYTIDCKHGWLLLLNIVDEIEWRLCIFNPITGYQIELPPILEPVHDFMSKLCTGCITLPPTDTKCTILIMYEDGKVHLCSLHGIMVWKTFYFSEKYLYKTVFFNEKIYTMESFGHTSIYVVDTLLSKPVKHEITMDCSDICWALRGMFFYLVEFLGDLVMVILDDNLDAGDNCVSMNDFEFNVYRADFLKNKWVKMETLGDHAFFVDSCHIFSSPATDVGCKKNTIYYAKGFRNRGIEWRSFDLDTRSWTDGVCIAFSSNKNHCGGGDWYWFIPTLDHLGADKAIKVAF